MVHFEAWARWSEPLPILAVSAVAVWTYRIAAQMFATGVFDRTRALDMAARQPAAAHRDILPAQRGDLPILRAHSTGHELDRPIAGGSAVVDAARSNHSTRYPISLRHILDHRMGRHAGNGDEGIGVVRERTSPTVAA